MSRKIEAAGAASPWSPGAASLAVPQAVRELEASLGVYPVRAGRERHNGWSLVAGGLLQSLAGLTTDASGKQHGCHGATASRRFKVHKALVPKDSEYAERAGLVARNATDRTFPR